MPLTAEDRLEIMELSGRYSFAIDRCLPEEWANVFTDDGEVRKDGKVLAAGRRQLEDYMRAGLKLGKDKLRHHTSNVVVEEGDNGGAKMRSYVVTWDLAGAGIAPRFIGEYNDTLVKVNGKWKFKLRLVTEDKTAGRVL